MFNTFAIPIQNNGVMKTLSRKRLFMLIILLLPARLWAQPLVVQPELKELIYLAVARDRTVKERTLEKELTLEQRQAVRMAYFPSLELGGKYLYTHTGLNTENGEIRGLEPLAKLQEFMQNPAFPQMFPTLAGLSDEIIRLQQLMAQQGIALQLPGNTIDGTLYGQYYGVDASAKMLLYSGGQVPNLSRALTAKVQAQEAMTDKSISDAIAGVIKNYDQLALLGQSKKVLDESAERLKAERKFAASALKNGFATPFDTLRIGVAEAMLNAKMADYEGKRTLLIQNLARLTGKPAEYFSALNPDLQPMVYSNAGAGINNRAEVKALSAGLMAAGYKLRAEKSHYMPKVQAMASLRYDNVFNADAGFSKPYNLGMGINNITLGPTVLAGVGFKWELFNRSGGSSSIKQAQLEQLKARNALDKATELLQLNRTQALTSYQSALTQVIYRQKQRDAAANALNLAIKAYNEGMIGITERLAAETDFQQSELEVLQAVFAQRQSAVDCYLSTGSLSLSSLQ